MPCLGYEAPVRFQSYGSPIINMHHLVEQPGSIKILFYICLGRFTIRAYILISAEYFGEFQMLECLRYDVVVYNGIWIYQKLSNLRCKNYLEMNILFLKVA